MEILLGIGVDSIHFGMSEYEATQILGDPDKDYETDSDCRRLQFNEQRLELSFEPDNKNLLGWIEVHNPNATLFGKKLIGLEEATVLSFLNNHLNENTETNDYGSFISVSYDNQWLELQFQFGCLENIQFGVIYNETDDPLWPAT